MMETMQQQQPELWGGVECTVNRVNDEYFDQLRYSGHDRRLDDLDRFAAIGLKTIRYPFLWEHVHRAGAMNHDWRWADQRLARLSQLGIRPIAGLVHHGSGPACTNLIDENFGPKLAEYAAQFAQRYPWVDLYTPVNEPLTTARFSALYGVWYPHRSDPGSFARALINQCRGVALAMRAIRKVNPQAMLVQTDDLGKTSATAPLRYQADFENERRWLTWDLLSGRLNPAHSMWAYLIGVGVRERELRWFEENPCVPDIIGINHYVLSNRYLDHRVERYPENLRGGNDRVRYADVDAVRVAEAPVITPDVLLKEAWERYHLPVAITEVHLEAGREDQLRWFMEVWNAACRLREAGADVRAVTIWGLLGHFDWHCLLSRCEGHYECGVFDVRSPQPRATAQARMVESLTTTGEYQHPVLDLPGWWRRPERVLYPSVVRIRDRSNRRRMRPIVITGARGTLGRAFERACCARGLASQTLVRQFMDIADANSVRKILDVVRPWAVVNTAGYVRVDDAELEPDHCFRENLEGPSVLAQICAERDIPLVSFSSDLVFDGLRGCPYVESSSVAPLNVYGRSKAEAEAAILGIHPGALVIRTSAFFSPFDGANFLTQALAALRQHRCFAAATDLRVSPTYVPDLVNATLDLLIDRECGIWHLANQGEVTWYDFARETANAAGLDTSLLVGRPSLELGLVARRPQYSALGTQRGQILPPLEKGIERYLDLEREHGCSA